MKKRTKITEKLLAGVLALALVMGLSAAAPEVKAAEMVCASNIGEQGGLHAENNE